MYLDDILIFSPDLNTRVATVQEVLQRLLSHKCVKTEKHEFHKNLVSFLGYVISESQDKLDQQKVHAVINWPVPSSRKDVQLFGDSQISIKSSLEILVLLLLPSTHLLPSRCSSTGLLKLKRPSNG